MDWVQRPSEAQAEENLLDAIACFARDHRSEIDALLITGDLSHRGNQRDLLAALQFVDGPTAEREPGKAAARTFYRQKARGWHTRDERGEVRPSLAGAGLPVRLLPGNHDRFQTLRAPGGRAFDGFFSHHWDVGQGVKVLEPLAKDGESLTFVAADCTLRRWSDADAFGMWGQGRVYPAVEDAMRLETRRLASKEGRTAVIWALHFPPDSDDPSGDDRVEWPFRLLDGERVLAAMEETGAEFLFAGHIHECRDYPCRNARVQVFCADSAAAMTEPVRSLHVIEVEVEEGSIVDLGYGTVSWDHRSESFLPMPPRPARIGRLLAKA